MFFKTSSTFNFTTYETVTYYRLVESYRNAIGQPRQRTILSHAVYPASELKTADYIRENSSICELSGYPIKKITKDKLYDIAEKLYSEKDNLEKFLSKRTNELFDLQDKIILYDLTNTYFEGRMAGSKKAKFGRSKEKRSDCKLLVLALVVNVEGFIKYSTIYGGNMADCKTLAHIVDNLRTGTSVNGKKAVVVMDAGIATKENIELLKSKGYDYVCVSRSNLTNVLSSESRDKVHFFYAES